MSLSRAISEGPAVISWDSFNYYTEGTITLTPAINLREKTSALYGVVDRRVTDKHFTLTFQPFGEINNNLAKYYPYGIADIGKLIAPGVDKPVIIYCSSGEKITLPAACIIQPPSLLLGTDQGPLGEMQFACFGDLAKADAAADSLYKIETASIAAHTLNPAHAPTPAYKCTIGATDYDAETGFTFDPGMNLTPRIVNRYGTINYRLSALNPSLTFQPFGPSIPQAAELWNVQGLAAAKFGQSNSLGKQLTIEPVSGAGITITFPDCQVSDASLLFGMDDPRHGSYTFHPVLKVVAGVPQPLYTITLPDFDPGAGGE